MKKFDIKQEVAGKEALLRNSRSSALRAAQMALSAQQRRVEIRVQEMELLKRIEGVWKAAASKLTDGLEWREQVQLWKDLFQKEQDFLTNWKVPMPLLGTKKAPRLEATLTRSLLHLESAQKMIGLRLNTLIRGLTMAEERLEEKQKAAQQELTDEDRAALRLFREQLEASNAALELWQEFKMEERSLKASGASDDQIRALRKRKPPQPDGRGGWDIWLDCKRQAREDASGPRLR